MVEKKKIIIGLTIYFSRDRQNIFSENFQKSLGFSHLKVNLLERCLRPKQIVNCKTDRKHSRVACSKSHVVIFSNFKGNPR